MKIDHKHMRTRRPREKHDARLSRCPHCGRLTRGLRQHMADMHTGNTR